MSALLSACGNSGNGTNGAHDVAPSPALLANVSVVNGTASFSGLRDNYRITRTYAGYTVSDKLAAGVVSTVPLTAQTLRFADYQVNLGIGTKAQAIGEANLQSLAELYVAFFNRVPDADGLSYWIDQLASGKSLAQISESFYGAAIQYSSLTGYSAAMSNADFVKVIYKNVLGRDSVDAQGLAYWTASLANGSQTRGSLIAAILQIAHTYEGDATFGWVADLLDNKYSVAKYFAVQQGLNFNTDEQSITDTMAIAAAVGAQGTVAALKAINVSDASFTTEPVVPSTMIVGATLPYAEFEAEDGETNGTIIGPSRQYGDFANEATGRKAVRLEANGQFVRFRTKAATNSIVVRYAIPDAPTGGGINATIGLYINGVRTKSLQLTSRYTWVYGGDANWSDNNPASGKPHHFYDEVQALIGDVPAGATIALQKDGQDTAAFYIIDLVDFEQVAPPLTQPAGSVSIEDFGARADGSDASAAIQQAIDYAAAQKKQLWIPPGTYTMTKNSLYVPGVVVRGAGMWYSKLAGVNARIFIAGSNFGLYDFALFGDVTERDDKLSVDGIRGAMGSGSRIERLWIEHQKAGIWMSYASGSPKSPQTDGLVVSGVRVRNTFADGINFCNGTSNSIVEQSSFRNTGDDAVATWSPSFDGVPGTGNIFRFNTVQTPWAANCFAIYGGGSHTIQDSLCTDVPQYSGVRIGFEFNPYPFTGTNVVERVRIVRAGAPFNGGVNGALTIRSAEGPIGGLVIRDVEIRDATTAGVQIEGANTLTGLVLDNVQINGAGTAGIFLLENARGNATASRLTVSGAAVALKNDANSAWTFTRLSGNSGW